MNLEEFDNVAAFKKRDVLEKPFANLCSRATEAIQNYPYADIFACLAEIIY